MVRGFIGCALIHQLNEFGREDILVVDRCEDVEANKNLASCKYDSFIDADEFLAYARGFDKKRRQLCFTWELVVLLLSETLIT